MTSLRIARVTVGFADKNEHDWTYPIILAEREPTSLRIEGDFDGARLRDVWVNGTRYCECRRVDWDAEED